METENCPSCGQSIPDKCITCGDYMMKTNGRLSHKATHTATPNEFDYCTQCGRETTMRGRICGHVWDHYADAGD